MMDMTLYPYADSCARPCCSVFPGDRLAFDLVRQSCRDEWSRLRVILMGSPEEVNRKMLNLYHRGYEIEAWSEPQEMPGTGEVISAYTKRSLRTMG